MYGNPSDRDTIAQRATAAGEAAVALIRISGDRTHGIVDRLFVPSRARGGRLRVRHAHHGHLVDGDTGAHVDEVLVTLFAEGSSYTGEAMAEIGCHGGTAVADRVLRAVFAAGARPAEPGEFSKRAFLNGRMDLAQAEAVCDLIRGRSDAAVRSALRQLEGGLSARIKAIRGPLLDLLAEIEATIDFPDDDILPATTEKAVAVGEGVRRLIGDLLARAVTGQAVREGVAVSIVGRPNVGKSSLLNALLGRDRAIVTDIPGTTRDTVEETAVLSEIPFRLIDTAGLRWPGDDLEAIGVSRAEAAAAGADVCVVVFDAGAPLQEADDRVIERLGDVSGVRVGVLNKSDLPVALDAAELRERLGCNEWLTTSAISPGGVQPLIEALVRTVATEGVSAEGELLTNVRHRRLLEAAGAELEQVALARERGMPIDIVAVSVRAAAEALGEITGETLVPDLLDRIFSTFCLGK